MKIFLIFVAFCVSLAFNDPLKARKKLDEFSIFRIGGIPYRDSTAQRGMAFHLDYSSNKSLSNQYYSVFVDYDLGFKYVQTQEFLDEPREFNNSRFDIGAIYGLNMISNIRSRFYFGLGAGATTYTFTDSTKVSPYEYTGFFHSYHMGAEVRYSKKLFVFIEYYIKRLPTRGEGNSAYEDSFELQQANIERWIGGVGYAF